MMDKAKKQILSIEKIALDNFPPSDLRISGASLYGDMTWDFRDGEKARLRGLTDAKLIIEWDAYLEGQAFDSYRQHDFFVKSHLDARISRGVLEDIRTLCFMQLEFPGVFKSRGRQIQRSKPQTVVRMARALVVLASVIDEVRKKRILAAAPNMLIPPLQSMSEVNFQDLSNAVLAYPFADGTVIEQSLKLFASPVLRGKFHGASVQWTLGDIENLVFPRPTPRDEQKVMPDALFRLLSNSASEDVAFFADALKWQRYDKTTPVNPSSMLPVGINLAQAWEDYVQIRLSDREYAAQVGKRASKAITRRKAFVRAYGVTSSTFYSYIQRLQRACMTLLGLYTGGRFSDFTSFVSGCIQEKYGMPMLVGTQAKHQALGAPENNDIWPAIPVLRDVVKCLDELSRATHNPYLISSSYTVPIGDMPQPLTLTGFRGALNGFLRMVDVEERWKDWRINPHQLRHTLAHKLAQADVGVVYISYQLKHLYTALAALPADTTLGYGNIADQKMARAIAVKDLSREAANALFNPDSPIAGGGAEEFRQRRKVYFDGRVAEGWTRDEIIDQLAACGSPFVNVGPGYCGGVREEILADGKKHPPPCIGNLQCNTGDCNNAVVTQIHVSQWKDIVVKNKELASDPRLTHATENFEAAIVTGERVLRDLGIDPATL